MSDRSSRLLLPAVLLATALLYLPSLGNGYAMDDGPAAMGIPKPDGMVHRLRPIGDYFSSHYWRGHAPEDPLYRPVTVWSFALVHAASAPPEPHLLGREHRRTARAQHAVNALLHVVATALVWLLVRWLGVGLVGAAVAAAIFGVHAVHVEVVATIVGRSELLAFVFGACAVWLLVRAHGSRGAWAWRSVAAASLFVALGSKESAVAWIGFWVVVEWWGGRDTAGRSVAGRLARGAPFVVVPTIAFLAAWWSVIGDFGPFRPPPTVVNPLAHVGTVEQVATALYLWVADGLRLVLLPIGLAADYGPATTPMVRSAADPRVWGALAILVGLVLVALRLRHRAPLVALGIAAFVGFSAITANVLKTIGTVFGERLYYAPSFGVSLVAAWGIERAWSRVPSRRVALIVVGAWAIASCAVVVARTPVWRDDATLYAHEVENRPRSARMQFSFATVELAAGRVPSALAALERAVELCPEYPLAWGVLAERRLAAGDVDGAADAVRRGLACRFDHDSAPEDAARLHRVRGDLAAHRGDRRAAFDAVARALAETPADARLFAKLRAVAPDAERLAQRVDELARGSRAAAFAHYRGLLARDRGDGAAAERAFRDAIASDPAFAPARIELLSLLVEREDPEAVTHIAAGRRWRPESAAWDYYRAHGLLRDGRAEAALEAFLDALEHAGNYRIAWDAFWTIERRANRLADALARVEARAERRPLYPWWPFYRGIVLANTGDVDRALDAFVAALALDPALDVAWQSALALAREHGRLARLRERLDAGPIDAFTGSERWATYRETVRDALAKSASPR